MHDCRFQNIALVAPASRLVTPDEHLPMIEKQCQAYNLNITYQHDLIEALPPQQKADIFLEYLFDDAIDTIWAVRGGEGCADIIPYLHEYYHRIQHLKPKTLMGYSDITALLMYFSQTYGWRCIHGTGTYQWSSNHLNSDCQRTYDHLLEGDLPSLPLDDAVYLNDHPTPKKASYLTGGNLSLINISIQDIWQIQAHDRIVLLEEVKEPIHVINRSLKYLLRIGAFDGAQALIIGDCCQNDNLQALHNTLRLFASYCSFPVIKTDSFGHGSINYPWAFNSLYQWNSQPLRLEPTHDH